MGERPVGSLCHRDVPLKISGSSESPRV
jgi:hypothetical protein